MTPNTPHLYARGNFSLTPMERPRLTVRSQNHRNPLPHNTIATTCHMHVSIENDNNRRTSPQPSGRRSR